MVRVGGFQFWVGSHVWVMLGISSPPPSCLLAAFPWVPQRPGFLEGASTVSSPFSGGIYLSAFNGEMLDFSWFCKVRLSSQDDAAFGPGGASDWTDQQSSTPFGATTVSLPPLMVRVGGFQFWLGSHVWVMFGISSWCGSAPWPTLSTPPFVCTSRTRGWACPSWPPSLQWWLLNPPELHSIGWVSQLGGFQFGWDLNQQGLGDFQVVAIRRFWA